MCQSKHTEWASACVKALPWNAVNRLCFLSADSHRRGSSCVHTYTVAQCTAAPCTMSTRGESVIYIVVFLRESCLNVDDKQTVCQKICAKSFSLSVVCVWTCSIDGSNSCTACSPLHARLPSKASCQTKLLRFARIAQPEPVEKFPTNCCHHLWLNWMIETVHFVVLLLCRLTVESSSLFRRSTWLSNTLTRYSCSYGRHTITWWQHLISKRLKKQCD